MRWDELFADLDARFAQLSEQDEDAELADRVRSEYGALGLVQRLAGARGRQLRLLLPGGLTAAGRLERWGPDWLLLAESAAGDGTELIVPLAAVTAVEGLTAATGQPLGSVDSRYDLRLALRAVARDRSAVRVHTGAGTPISGTLDRVGADFVELAGHAAWEPRRAAAVRQVVLVPLAAIVLVRAQPLA